MHTFPNDFEFAGNLTSQAKQVGNTVPVALAKTIGLTLATESKASRVVGEALG